MRSHSIFQDQKITLATEDLIPPLNSINKKAGVTLKYNLNLIPLKKAEFFIYNKYAQKENSSISPREHQFNTHQGSSLFKKTPGLSFENFSYQKLLKKDVNGLWPNRAFILGEALEQPYKKKLTTQIVLTFSSFVKKDLNCAFTLFQNYLTALTNQLTNYNCVDTIILGRDSVRTKSLPLLDYILYTKYFNFCTFALEQPLKNHETTSNSLNLSRVAEDTTKGEKPVSKKLGRGSEQTPFLFPKGCSKDDNGVGLIAMKHAHPVNIADALRTTRLLNTDFLRIGIPQHTKLYTVIRSPHVFKKTREQFATTQHKQAIKLQFCSDVSFRIFLDSFVLLKLPAEVKMLIKSL